MSDRRSAERSTDGQAIRKSPLVASLTEPPTSLLARVRWLFLLLATAAVVSLLVRVLGHSDRPQPLRISALVLLGGLLAYWCWGHYRSRFPLPWLPLELFALVACAVGADHPVMGVGVLYSAVAFRATYSTWSRAISYTALAVCSYLVGVDVATMLGGTDVALSLAPLPGVPVMGVIVHLVAVASRQAERASARERIVSRAGLAIATAKDREQLANKGLAAFDALLRDVVGAKAHLVLDVEEVHPLLAGARLELPLTSAGHTMGAVVIDSDRSLPAEILDALETVSGQLALGLAAVTATANLCHRATHDPLTDLANRAAVDAALARALSVPSPQTALLLLDLDGFKQVNDRFGHAAGDLLLRAVADRLRACVRRSDLVARLGGDEFVVLLDGPGVGAQARRLADRIRCDLATPVVVDDAEVAVTVSVGLAVARAEMTADALLREADADMYRAKRNSRTL